MRRLALVVLALCALVAPALSAGATTRVDRSGTILVDGRKVFPIVLGKGPERGSTTPAGGDGLAEIAAAGVNFVKVGPGTCTWTSTDIADAIAWNRAAAAHGLYTWVNLATLARARPNTWRAALLRNVIAALERDPSSSALGMWKGADEPWRYRTTIPSLRFAYCLATSRGDRRWCEGKRPADSDHLWVTVQPARGSRGTAASPTSTASTTIRSRSATPSPTSARWGAGRTSWRGRRPTMRSGRRSASAGGGATTARATSPCRPGASSDT